MKAFVLSFAVLAVLAVVTLQAHAGNCTTTCHPTGNGGSSCFTNCY